MAETSLATAFVTIVPSLNGFDGKMKSQLGSKMSEHGKESGRAFGGAFKGLIGGLALFGGVTAGISLLKKQFESLARIEVINKQTETVIKSMGNAANVSAQQVNDLAQALEKKTATEAESIQKGANLLLTFGNIRNEAGKGNDIFNQTTTLMVDMARAMGTDASSGAIQLGKALNDPSRGLTALTRVGVSFSQEQKNMVKRLQESGDMMGAQKIILSELQKQFGGSGAAYADTFAGQLELIKHAGDNVGEALVGVAMPGLKAFTGFIVENVIPATDAFSERWTNGTTVLQQVFKGNVGALTSSLNNMTSAISGWISGGGISTLLEGFVQVRATIMNALAGALPGIIISLVNSITTALPMLIETLLSMVPQLLQTAMTLFTSLIQAFGTVVPMLITSVANLLPKLVESMVKMLPSIIQTAINLFTGILTGLMTAIPKIITALLDALPKIVAALVSALPLIINGAIQLFIGLVQGLVKVIPQLITTLTTVVLPKLIETVVSLIPILIPAAIQLFLAIVTGLSKAIPEIIGAVIKLVPVIVKALIGMQPQLLQAGIDIVKGLVKGMVDNAPTLIGGAVKGLADLVVGGFKALLGIKSPSRVFKEFGKNIIQGLVKGLTEDEQSVIDTMQRVADWVETSFSDGKIYKKTAQAAQKLVEVYSASLAPVAKQHDAIMQQLNDAQDVLKGKIEERLNYIRTITERFGSKLNQDEAMTAQDAIDRLKARIAKTKELSTAMAELQVLGLSGDLYQQIIDTGNLDFAKSILAGGTATVQQLNTLAEEANATALQLGTEAGDILFNKGIEVAQGVVDGLKSKEAELSAMMANIAQSFANAIAGVIQADTRQADVAAFDSAAKAQDKAQTAYDAAVKKFGKNSKQAKTALTTLTKATAAEKAAKAVLSSNLRATVPTVQTPAADSAAGSVQVVNYYAAPNNSLDSEQALRTAMVRSAIVMA